MKTELNEIEINGVAYVRKSEASALAPAKDGLQQVMIRSAASGVHFGWLKCRNGEEVTLLDARRVWYWAGAFTLSQLATEGTSKPQDCKFSVAVPEITVLGVCEIIPLTAAAAKNLNQVSPCKS